jgi:hypothetical protein
MSTTDGTDSTQSTADSATQTGDGQQQPTADDQGAQTAQDAALGDAGKKAIDAMKAERNAARDEARTLRSELDKLKAQIDGREAEHKAAEERQRIQDEALAQANDRILKAEVRAAAAGKLADPGDAMLYIDLSEFEVSSDGAVNSAAIARAIDDLITSKPYLAAQGQRFQGGADGGARNDASKPSQLTRDDMKRMSPEQIVEAQAKGQFDELLAKS